MSDQSGKNGSANPDDLSWSDWEERTQQREAPSSELLDAMKHPDVPAVVLNAIARRSSSPPARETSEKPEEETTDRYVLQPGAPVTARIAQVSTRPGSRVFIDKPEDSLFMAYVMGFVMIAAVVGWMSFGLLRP